MDIVVPYNPNDRQKIFHSCPAEEVVYGGAKGGGKSCALVMEALAYALEYQGAELYLFRETYDDLEANIIKEWKEKVPQELYKYNETKHIAHVIGGSRVYFRFINNKADAEKYNGRSIDWIGVDELTKHEEESIQILLSCLRSPKGFPPRFRGTCNPGGIGHVWVKKRYIQATSYGKEMTVDPVTGNRIAFIPAKVYDNPVLMKNDPAYVRRLENLPPAKKKAYLEGDWDAYEGQAFEEWNPEIHVCRPFEIPPWWRRWRGNDPGYADPFAWYWLAVSPDGIVYCYREYTRDPKDPRVTYSDQAREVMRLSKNEDISFTVVGRDAWNRVGRGFSTGKNPSDGKSIVDCYIEGGLTGCIPPPTEQNVARKARKAVLHEYLKPFEDERTGRTIAKLQIFSTCTRLIEALPNLVVDDKDAEKVSEEPHIYTNPYDAIGYALVAWHVRHSKPPEPEKTEFQRDKERLARLRKRRKRIV